MRYALTPLLLIFVCLASCGTLGEDNASAKLIVQYAILDYVGESTDRASRVVEVIDEVEGYLATDTPVTVDLLKGEAYERIDFNQLKPADRLLAANIVELLANKLTERVGQGQLDATQKLRVSEVLGWAREVSVFLR
jgi:hypothetical protein